MRYINSLPVTLPKFTRTYENRRTREWASISLALLAFAESSDYWQSSLELTLNSYLCVGRIQQLVRGFASDWKRSIENINQEIMRSFSNFKNGTAILQVRVRSELLLKL